MKEQTYYFSAEELNQLHIKAEDLWRVQAKQGWQRSPVSPMEILELFKGIRIKDGYTLRGYIYREGMSGFGVVWALPEAEFPEVERCERLDLFGTPRPKNAMHFMDVLEGDKTPQSYINASLFYREMLEFGAVWHGLSWGLHEIIERIERTDLWEAEDLRPKVILGERAIVEFYTLCGLYRWRIFKHRDVFIGYRIRPSVTLIAEGEKGYVP
ncbi:MAG: hypothetical protein H0Z28_07410 [Archaeoglobus sp.]|nr:hypothetical protein [Archaeoglobus sp.]